MISGSDVFDRLFQDPKTPTMPAAVAEAARPYIVYLPELLADSLATPLTLDALMAAKMKFMRHLVDSNYIKDVVAAMPEDSLSWYTREDLGVMMQEMMETLMPMVEQLTNRLDMQALLEAAGLTEEEALMSPKLGMGPELAAMYREGTATLEDVLRLQPGLIVNNTD